MNDNRKNQTLRKRNNSGFLMVEILIVAAIIVGALLVALAVADRSIKVSRQAMYSAQASFLLEEGAEAVRILRDNDWDNVDSTALSTSTDYYPTFSGGTWIMSTTANTVGIFTRTVHLENVNRNASTGDIDPSGILDTQTRLVEVVVSWQDGSTTLSKNLSFYINDIFGTDD